MAEDDTEKTEDPSQKRLEEALRHGDVAKSQEVNVWFVIAASALVLLSFSSRRRATCGRCCAISWLIPIIRS
jgi:flagellar biosynthesis protein FlhB